MNVEVKVNRQRTATQSVTETVLLMKNRRDSRFSLRPYHLGAFSPSVQFGQASCQKRMFGCLVPKIIMHYHSYQKHLLNKCATSGSKGFQSASSEVTELRASKTLNAN